jgi:hypothetical protein
MRTYNLPNEIQERCTLFSPRRPIDKKVGIFRLLLKSENLRFFNVGLHCLLSADAFFTPSFIKPYEEGANTHMYTQRDSSGPFIFNYLKL